MPANLPSPVVGAGGSQRQNPIATLLMSLVQQAAGYGLQRALTPAPQPTQGELSRSALEQQSSAALQGMAGTPENNIQTAAVASGLGNANVPTQDVAGLSAIPTARATAPERLAAIQEKKQADDAAAAADRIRQRTIAALPEHLRPVVSFMLDAKQSGAGDSAINDVLPHLLPPTEAQALANAKTAAETDEIKLRLGQLRRDTRFRQEMAKRIGLSSEYVTDGMITSWMNSQEGTKPDAVANRMLMDLIGKTVIDPLGQAKPAFSVEDAAARAEAGVQLLIPGYKFNMTPEQRMVATAGGILRAAASREKMLNPTIKTPDLAETLFTKARADFPALDPQRIQELVDDAIKSNMLTGGF